MMASVTIGVGKRITIRFYGVTEAFPILVVVIPWSTQGAGAASAPREISGIRSLEFIKPYSIMNSWILTLGVELASTGLIAGFVTIVTRGVVFAITPALLRISFSTGSHGWRQLVDTKVRTALTTRRRSCLSLQVSLLAPSELIRDPAQRMKTPESANGIRHHDYEVEREYFTIIVGFNGVTKTCLRKFKVCVLTQSITDIRYVLTQRALTSFCETYHILDEVHLQLPSPNQTIHEMPSGKIGVHTRFFEYANYRLPLSTSFVNILRYYCIHISQLSVIGAAKVSHFKVLYRVYGFEPTVGLFRCFYVNSKNKGWMFFSKRPRSDVVCYTKPLDSLKNWNDHFFWVDDFACPASFPRNTSKGVPRDLFPKSFEFNAKHYATLVAFPAPFHKYSKPFLCLVGISRYYTLDEDAYPEFLGDNDEGIDLLAFIRTADPTKVRVAERQRAKDEPRVLESTVGRVVSLLLIAPARASSELKASVDRLFDEGASGDGQDADVQPVAVTTNTIVEDVAPLQPRRQRKRKIVVADVGGPSHPPKKLREDSEAEARGEPVSTLPFATSSVSATPERKDRSPTDSVPRPNLRTIGAPQRFVISSDSSHHSSANIAEAEVDSIIRSSASAIATVTTVTAAIDTEATVTRAPVAPSLFGVGSSSTGREKRKLRAVVDEQAELLKTKDGEIESLKAQLLLKEAEAAEAIRLWAEVFKFESAGQSLRGKVGFLRDQNTAFEREKNELNVKVTDLSACIKVREQEVADLDAQVHELDISSTGLQEKVAAYEGFVSQLEKFQDEKLEEVNEKFNKLCADFVEMAMHLKEKFYPHLLTTISGRRWLLTYGMELAVAKCLNSTEYLSALGAAISKAVEKGMQEKLSAGITHGAEGRQLADVATYNPSAEADYLSALQYLQSVNFSLIAKLKSNKDASVDTIMNLLRLDDVLTERLGLTESQPYVDQLMVPIHHSTDQRVVGAFALTFSLEVSNSRVKKMRENIANHVSVLCGVFVPLSEPLSATALEGMEGTSGFTPDVATLSTTFVSASTIPPISTDDYEVAHADGQGDARVDDETAADNDMNLFVSSVNLNISE
uniref:Transposase (Putative), gypsy type n=1 Tax=Tanacetum cinerariifolium TaxID=118510 RepID=A0A6L2J991_TANCI|nr:hypothetical protein [Tanacetum cinerariifolium]